MINSYHYRMFACIGLAITWMNLPSHAFLNSHKCRRLIAPTGESRNNGPRNDCIKTTTRRSLLILNEHNFNNNNNDDDDDGSSSNNNHNNNKEASFLDRFLNPKIDDPQLPLTEAGIAQIIAPSLLIFWLVSQDAPYPTWAQPIVFSSSQVYFPARGSFLAPTLIHGAGLACCWLAGCLAANGYEKEKYERADIETVLTTTIKAGAFASGLLIFATQIDLFIEFGYKYVQFGDSPETDTRIVTATIELINDIVFEAGTLLTWRFIRSLV